MGLQFHRVHIDHKRAVLASKRRRHRGARDAGNLIANLILQVIVKLRLVQPLPLYGQQANWQARSIDLQNDWRQGAFRKAPQIRHGQIGNLRHVGVGIGAGLEIDLDQAYAGSERDSM